MTTLATTDIVEMHAQTSEECRLAVNEYGDGIAFDEAVYQQKVSYHLKRSAEEMLEGCKALLVTRIHLDDGRWGEFLRRVGLESSVARRMVAAARKFSSADKKPLVQAATTKSKLFEMLILDDEEITKISQGANDALITLDEVDRMTVTELRTALRDARADGDATKKVLEDKNKKLDKQSAELEKLKTTKADRPKTDYNLRQVRADLQGDVYELEIVLKRISKGLEALQTSDEGYEEVAIETMKKMQALMKSSVAEVGLDLDQPESTELAWLQLDDIEDAEVHEVNGNDSTH